MLSSHTLLPVCTFPLRADIFHLHFDPLFPADRGGVAVRVGLAAVCIHLPMAKELCNRVASEATETYGKLGPYTPPTWAQNLEVKPKSRVKVRYSYFSHERASSIPNTVCSS